MIVIMDDIIIIIVTIINYPKSNSKGAHVQGIYFALSFPLDLTVQYLLDEEEGRVCACHN